MDVINSTIQRNILAIFTATPESFYHKYEEVIKCFEQIDKTALIIVFNNFLAKLEEHKVPVSITAIPELLAVGDVEKVEMMAEALALSTLLYMHNSGFDKPFSWWKDCTMQLVDLSTPVSTVKH